MRTKNRGGKARLSTTHSTNTIMRSLPVLFPGKAADTCATKFADELSDLDLLEEESCFVCEVGGGENMLVCCQTGCPIAIHEKCLNSGSKLDDSRNFICPYCSYKREAVRIRELRRKVLEAKKALLAFIDCDNKDNLEQVSMSPTGRKRNHASGEMMDEDIENQLPHMEKNEKNDAENEKLTDSSDQLEKMVDENISEASTEDVLHAEPLTAHFADDSYGMSSKIRCDIGELKQGRREEENQVCAEASGTGTSDSDMETLSVRQRRANQRGKKVQSENVVLLNKMSSQENGTQKKSARGEKQKAAASTSPLKKPTPEKIAEAQEEKAASSKRSEEQASPNELSCPQNLPPRKIARVEKEKAAVSNTSKQPSPKKFAKTQKAKVASSERSSEQAYAKIPTNLMFAKEKRRRLHWTDEEEEMLKEGVQKFSSTARKNLSWRKILEFGRHVFDPTRTPMDLKDKWRNMLMKESMAGSST